MSKIECPGPACSNGQGHPPIRVASGHACDFDIPFSVCGRYSKRCGRPARWKWHRFDSEWFCEVHKLGVPDDYDSEEHYERFWSTADG